MAGETTACYLAVGSVTLVGVAGGARFLRGGSGVGLMTARAGLVALGRGLLLGSVASLAGRCLRSRMGLVTLGASRVPGEDLGALRGVAAVTAGLQRGWPVGQAAMTALAGSMSRVQRDLLDALLMTARADWWLGEPEHEVVRLVTVGASDAGVKVVVGRGLLMAATAVFGLIDARAGRMRIVAADARAHNARLGMVGVHVLVAILASLAGRAFHVMRRVAAHTLVVGRDPVAAEHVEIGVARAAGDDRLFREGVRSMAADALAMPTFEERRAGDDWALFGVAGCAGRQGVLARRVLVLMTGDAGLEWGLTAGSVAGLNVLVTIGAGRRDRLRILMRVMATRALLRAMDHDRRGVALCRGVAALAVPGRIRLQPANERRRAAFAFGLDVFDVDGRFVAVGEADRAVVPAAVEGKDVTLGTVCSATGAEALFRLLRGVAELALSLVTLGAAFRSDFADRALVHVVTLGTSDLGLDHVKAVAAHSPRREPGLLHVQTASIGPIIGGFSTTTAEHDRDDDGDQQRDRLMTTHRHRSAA